MFVWLSFLPNFILLVFTLFHSSPEIEYLYSFGNFVSPGSISLSPNGQFYVADTEGNKIKVYGLTGDSLREIGGYGWGQLEFDRPGDVYAGYGLNVYVADYGNHRIQRFDKDLNYISTLYARDDENLQKRFGYPVGVSLSRLGDLFLIDGENVRVVKVNAFSTIERSFGGIDAGKGRLLNPRQIHVSRKDIVCVLDGEKLVLYDYFGNFLRTLGLGVLKNPSGFTIENDTVYVIDRQTLHLFTIEGVYVRELKLSTGHGGEGAEMFRGLAISGRRAYVIGGHHIDVFSLVMGPLDNH